MNRLSLIAAAVAALAAGAAAAQDYPSRDVTIVVPYSPAGSVDPVGRFIAEGLQEKWGQNVVIDNRPGAGATIGTAYVATQPADGYTILLTSSAYTTAPSIQSDLPYDPLADLTAVAMPGFAPFVVTAGPSVEADDLEGFLDEAASREIFLATAGLGSSTHFAGELFTQAAGLNAVAVHYKGGAPAQVDLMGGRADIYVGSIAAVLGNVEAGKTKALAVLGDSRSDALPDVPSTAEAGMPEADSTFWFGVFVPAGTPDAIVSKLHDDVMAVMSSDAGKEWMANRAASVGRLSQADFAALVEREIAQWKDLAASRGIASN